MNGCKKKNGIRELIYVKNLCKMRKNKKKVKVVDQFIKKKLKEN